MERRGHERHDLSAPVKFEWDSPDNTHRQGTGITRNLSAGGVFVITDDPPTPGAIVHFEVDLDTSRLDSAVTVRAKGQVNRVEITDSAGGVSGFAVSSRRMRIQKSEAPSK
jgi:hypothetical protein